jgi:hypothetical protein
MDLRLLGIVPGGHKLEHAFHTLYADLRLPPREEYAGNGGREWFRDDPLLLGTIAALPDLRVLTWLQVFPPQFIGKFNWVNESGRGSRKDLPCRITRGKVKLGIEPLKKVLWRKVSLLPSKDEEWDD